jgi:MFS transporter, DHA1 family, multidrug resistance protein
MDGGNKHSFRGAGYAAVALAFASLGDAFLYPFLPVNSLQLGIPVAWVGVLLSINRFVRIVSNGLMVHVFAKYGLRLTMIISVVLAIISTAGYGFAHGIAVWVCFRICWGLSFSAMRLGALNYALQQSRKGFALGVSKSLQETGPMLTLFFAPWLLDHFNIHTIFLLLVIISCPALFFAWMLPKETMAPIPVEPTTFRKFPSHLNLITFVSAVFIDGILVVVIGILFLKYEADIDLFRATALAAFYLGYRRVCLVLLSFPAGWIADKLGLLKVFNLSLFFAIIGLCMIIAGWVGSGSLVVFTFYGINASVAPGAVSGNEKNQIGLVAENVTWRDIGAATGTIVGGLALNSKYLDHTLIVGIFTLTFLFMLRSTSPGRLKYSYSWK